MTYLVSAAECVYNTLPSIPKGISEIEEIQFGTVFIFEKTILSCQSNGNISHFIVRKHSAFIDLAANCIFS